MHHQGSLSLQSRHLLVGTSQPLRLFQSLTCRFVEPSAYHAALDASQTFASSRSHPCLAVFNSSSKAACWRAFVTSGRHSSYLNGHPYSGSCSSSSASSRLCWRAAGFIAFTASAFGRASVVASGCWSGSFVVGSFGGAA